MTDLTSIPVENIRYVKELYPRLKPLDDVIERYRDALANLPPIAVARDGVLVDGYHRWQAHVREGSESIAAENLGNLSDAEIIRESIKRNAIHGQQLSRADKKRLSAQLWGSFAHMDKMDREQEIAELLAVSASKVREWTKDERKAEQERLRAAVVDDWLNCAGSNRTIGERHGVDDKSVATWSAEYCQVWQNSAPASRQHFDVWSFPSSDDDFDESGEPTGDGGGQQSYFGALPSQVLENVLWLWTEPAEIVVDLFGGSGTTIDVAKAMGRRAWVSDIRGGHYSPHLPIHRHDATAGWPDDAPRMADLVFLDPPYWKQAKGKYSTEPGELAEMDLDAFYAAWASVIKHASEHAKRIAYITSPAQDGPLDGGRVVDLAFGMYRICEDEGLAPERRVIVTYQTQQATGQDVTAARENKRLLKLYRDLVVMTK